MRNTSIVLAAIAIAALPGSGASQGKRAVAVDDHSRFVSISDPQRSPEGSWVAYTVSTVDVEADKRNTDVWMVRWDGSEQRRLTFSTDSESSPRWSPDGKYLAFVSSRGTEDEKKRGAQIWLLDRRGGDAQKASDIKGGVSDIVWSPDSTRLAFVKSDEDPDDEPEKKDGWKRKTTPPIVIDRYPSNRIARATSSEPTTTSRSSTWRARLQPFSPAVRSTMPVRCGRQTASRSRFAASVRIPIPIARRTRTCG